MKQWEATLRATEGKEVRTRDIFDLLLLLLLLV
jgi:hypothetical protein